jgi:membrane protease YdiL (CAAX protease family)
VSSANTPAALLTRIAVVVYALLGAGSLAALCVRGHARVLAPDPGSPLARVGLAGPGVADLGALDVAVGLLLGLAVAALSQSAGDAPALRTLSRKLRELLRGLTSRQAIVLALASGVGEELLFRGVLFEELLPRVGSTWTLLVTSALFGAAHVGRDRRLLVWTVLSFAIGLLLGLLRLLTGALLAPIALHVAVNGLNLLVESWDQRAVDSRPA